MNTTTKTNRKVIVLSWIVAIVACAVFAWAIYYAPVPVPAGTLKLPEGKQPVEHRGALKPRAVKVAKLSEKMKAEQAQRTLPSRYAEQLVEQSEMSVKKSLKSQLLQFQKMAEKMRNRKESLLSQVEARKLRALRPRMPMMFLPPVRYRRRGILRWGVTRLYRTFMRCYVSTNVRFNRTTWR